MGKIYWQRVFILFFWFKQWWDISTLKGDSKCLGQRGLFLGPMCRGPVYSWWLHSLRDPHYSFLPYFISKERIHLPSAHIAIFHNNRFSWTSKQVIAWDYAKFIELLNKWLFNVYHFDVTWIRVLISFGLKYINLQICQI